MSNIKFKSILILFIILMSSSLLWPVDYALHWAKIFEGYSPGKSIISSSDSSWVCLTENNMVVFNQNGEIILTIETPFQATAFTLGYDNDFILVGNRYSTDNPLSNDTLGRISCISSAGNMLWHKYLSFQGISIQTTQDSSFVCGGIDSNQNGCLVKMNSTGEEFWTVKYPSSTKCAQIQRTNDSGYIFNGGTSIIMTNSNGEIISQTTNNDDRFTTLDSSMVFFGANFSNNIGEFYYSKLYVDLVDDYYQDHDLWDRHTIYEQKDDATRLEYINSGINRYVASDVIVTSDNTILFVGRTFKGFMRYFSTYYNRPLINIISTGGSIIYSVPRENEYKPARPVAAVEIYKDCFIICGSIDTNLWVAKLGEKDIAIEKHNIDFGNTEGAGGLSITGTSGIITFLIPYKGKTGINIYNIQGRVIKSLNSRGGNAEYNSIVWNGRNNHGRHMTSGIYLCRLYVDDEFKETGKIIYLR